jgi:hypothetical protein
MKRHKKLIILYTNLTNVILQSLARKTALIFIISFRYRYVMGNNPENLLVVDSGIITLRNRVTMEQYERLNKRYEGTVLSIHGKKSI